MKKTKKLLPVLLLLLLTGCKQKKRLITSPQHYSFKEVQTYKLDLSLKEISGLVWDKEQGEFLTHYDESGSLFVLDKASLQILPPSPYKFGKKGDYEDIALYNGTPYLLISDGKIIKVKRDSTGKVVNGEQVGQIAITGSNDFETLYADTARRALIIICKNCASDDKGNVSAYAFYPDSIGFVNEPVYRIDAAKIKEMAGKQGHHKTSKFQPSAASIHPLLKKLFIISSASSQLVIADLNGKPEQVYELGKKLFTQPEGLTFKNDGTMYISNEGVTSKATILMFRYKP
ncbi:MAG: hypothetical protein ACRDEB_00640 [Chitinophagaceae bacterium]